MRITIAIKLIVLTTLVSQSGAQADNSPHKSGSATFTAEPSPTQLFDQAAQIYDAHKYTEALRLLTKLHQRADLSAKNLQSLHERLHYYMGLCYQSLNQVNPAKQEFAWVYQNAKDVRLRYSSQIAFQQLNYYQAHRSYAGQGNVFARESTSPARLPLSGAETETQQPNPLTFDYNAAQHFTITSIPTTCGRR